MKKIFILGLVAFATVLAVSTEANAQMRKKKIPGTTPTTTPPGTGPTTAPPPTTGTGGVVAEKRFDTTQSSSSNQFGGTVKPSLRNVFGYDNKNTAVKDRAPLSYEHLREDDIVFSHFIWREIDAREKMNKVFSYPAKEEGQDQRFFAIILDALKDTGSHVVAFSGEDDKFTTPMTYDSIMSIVSSEGGNQLDTQYVQRLDDQNVYDTVITKRANPFAPKPDSIYTFRILEQVMFDKESSRLFTRILGIAPIAMISTDKSQPSRRQLLFWIYYPDLRPVLAKTFAYNARNASGRMTWEEIFESRFFSSYIVKSSMDNPTDKSLRELIKDPLFRLLEGENIKDKIFNYEQNLWAY